MSVRRLRSSLALAVSLTALAALIPATAPAAPAANNSATNWKAYDLNASGQALRSRQGDRVAGAVSGFSFNAFPATTSYFLTDQPSYRGTLLGDLTNKTITAQITVTGTGFAYDPTDNPCGTPPTVRLFFQKNNQGQFDPAHYWWANPGAVGFAPLGSGGTFTLSATVTGSQWTDLFGQSGAGADAQGFNDSAADVGSIGLSFGGGCFFANGVGATGGPASLVLNSISVS